MILLRHLIFCKNIVFIFRYFLLICFFFVVCFFCQISSSFIFELKEEKSKDNFTECYDKIYACNANMTIAIKAMLKAGYNASQYCLIRKNQVSCGQSAIDSGCTIPNFSEAVNFTKKHCSAGLYHFYILSFYKNHSKIKYSKINYFLIRMSNGIE